MKRVLSKAVLASLMVVALVSCVPNNQNYQGNNANGNNNSTYQSNNSNGNNNSTSQGNNYIDEQKAKSIALEHAKLNEQDVTFVKVQKDMDYNRQKYEIEFWKDNKEYDYEIDATTGEILSYDYDIENYNIPNSNQSQSAAIDQNKAKEIALSHANLKESDVQFGKVEFDVDDGRKEYDVVFYYDNKEYEYTIDADTGTIIEYGIDGYGY